MVTIDPFVTVLVAVLLLETALLAWTRDLPVAPKPDHVRELVDRLAMVRAVGAVAERMKLWAFLAFAVVMTGFIYPVQGFWKWG